MTRYLKMAWTVLQVAWMLMRKSNRDRLTRVARGNLGENA